MKKVLLIGGGALVLILGGFGAFVATRPAEYHIERHKTLTAGPAEIMPHLTDMEAFTKWNPWDELDPDMDKTFSDPKSGVGAYYTWSGNEDVGKGRMEILEVTETKVTYKLEFIEPFASEATTYVTLAPGENGTQATWGMDGENDFMAKAFTMFVDMDAMVGADFEKGLDKLEARTTPE